MRISSESAKAFTLIELLVVKRGLLRRAWGL
ncbi:MAG TPA: prepilin-type N-terminal cleavage/methylation domain-containing protein [Verrucomicrobiae bacterium]|nr:prepilin-type N-terminal cleavage/methylation domain-containing protein [Verrucomicrobiae bacterium]